MKKTNLCLILCLVMILCGTLVACNNKVYFNITVPSEQVGYTLNAFDSSTTDDNANIYQALENKDFVFRVRVDEGYDIETLVVAVDGEVQTNARIETTDVYFTYLIPSVVSDHTITVSVDKKIVSLKVDFRKPTNFGDEAFTSIKRQFVQDVSSIALYKYNEESKSIGAYIFSIAAQLVLMPGAHKNVPMEILYGDKFVVEIFSKSDSKVDLFEHSEKMFIYEHFFDYGNNLADFYSDACYILRNNYGEKIRSEANPNGARLIVQAKEDGNINLANLYPWASSSLNVTLQAPDALTIIERVGYYDFAGSIGTATPFNAIAREWKANHGDYCFNVNQSMIVNPEDEIERLHVYVNGVELAKNPGQKEHIAREGYTGELGTSAYDYCIPLSFLQTNYFVDITVEAELKETARTHHKLEVQEIGFTNALRDCIDYRYMNIYGRSLADNKVLIAQDINYETYNFRDYQITGTTLIVDFRTINYTSNINLESLVNVSRYDETLHQHTSLQLGTEYEVILLPYDSENTMFLIFISIFDSQITNDIVVTLDESAFERKTYGAKLPIIASATTYYLNGSKEWVEITSANQTITVNTNSAIILKAVPKNSSFTYNGLDCSGVEGYVCEPFLLVDTFSEYESHSSDGNYYIYVPPIYQFTTITFKPTD